MFFSEVEGHMQKLSSFGRGKKFGLKSHLDTWSFHAALQLHCLDYMRSTLLYFSSFYHCSFPKRPQPLWKHISDQHPDLWVWLGDGMTELKI